MDEQRGAYLRLLSMFASSVEANMEVDL